jgi:hypothetical protein
MASPTRVRASEDTPPPEELTGPKRLKEAYESRRKYA